MVRTSSGGALCARSPQVVTNERAIGTFCRRQQMYERQCALSLVEVPEYLLAVEALLPDEIEEIVADLEGGAEVKSEPHQRRQLHRAA